jgi:hypothetical protein
MAAGFYAIVRTGARNPALISGGTAIQTSRQITAHLLCANCERRFNECGENWMIENCWQRPGEFPLREKLLSTQPLYGSRDEIAYYSATVVDLDVKRMVYFAASVFWRAAVHSWKTGNDQVTRLHLGPFAEPLREYLLGGCFPVHVVLLANVGVPADELMNAICSLPYATGHARHHSYRFDVPGLMFLLEVGRSVPKEWERICLARSGVVAISSALDRLRLYRMLGAATRAEKKGRLRAMHFGDSGL